MELRTLANFALHPNASAMSFDEVLGDGKAQPGTADFAGPRNIHAVEPFKDARLVYFGNADSRVGNGELDLISVG